jgi:CCR4-NOT transcription complex subunit 6
MQLGFRAGGRLVHSTDASRRRIPKSESAIDYDETDHAVWDVRPFVEDSGWTEVGKERNYVPTPADVGHVLKLVVGALSQDGSATTVTTTSDETPVVIGPPPPPPKRRLIHAHHVLMNPQFADSTALQFRVVTYNILADIYATQQIFPYCPKWALSWRYRRVQILRELEQYDADIICLQEVQQDHFQQFLLPALTRLGYDGVYKPKTREALGPVGKIDGCATLYRRDKFTLVETQDIEFNKAAHQMAQQGAFASSSQARDPAGGGANPFRSNLSGGGGMGGSGGGDGAPNDTGSQRCLKRLCKDNVAHVLILEGVGLNGEVEHICVANTHIFWDPDYPDVKLWQTHVLLQELEGIAGPRQLPLILCGDFNSTPESSVVELLAQESVDPKHPDFAFDKVGILPPASQLTHTLGLVSAVALVTGSEPPVTNYTGHYKGVLDYVWLNESLAAVACLEMPTEEELRGVDDSPLPNSLFPSDHVAICVDIRMASHGAHGGPSQGGGGY